MIKSILSPSQYRYIKRLLRRQVDEVGMIYKLFHDSVNNRVMVDVGAHQGGALESFAYDEWQVYAFEPDSKNRTILKKNCGSFPSVYIDSRAISNCEDKRVSFFTSDVSSGISGLSAFHDSHTESYQVDTVTLRTFCMEAGITKIGFLKIDTEGFDLFVLRGFPWDKIKPEIILFEFEDRKTVPLGYKWCDMANYLVEKGYYLIVSEWYPVVKYGTLNKWRRFVSYPCELLDNNAHGNVFAIRDERLYEKLRLLTKV